MILLVCNAILDLHRGPQTQALGFRPFSYLSAPATHTSDLAAALRIVTMGLRKTAPLSRTTKSRAAFRKDSSGGVLSESKSLRGCHHQRAWHSARREVRSQLASV